VRENRDRCDHEDFRFGIVVEFLSRNHLYGRVGAISGERPWGQRDIGGYTPQHPGPSVCLEGAGHSAEGLLSGPECVVASFEAAVAGVELVVVGFEDERALIKTSKWPTTTDQRSRDRRVALFDLNQPRLSAFYHRRPQGHWTAASGQG
jgi:hypothetical protein